MANYDRGVYEPPSDDIRVFDGGEDDIDDEGSRLPLLIVIALLVLAAFAGVVWLAYTQGVQRGRSDAPRIIAAAPGPDKVAPDNSSGEASQYQGLKIYEQPAPPDDEVADDETPSGQQANAPALRPQQAEVPAPQQHVEAPPQQHAAVTTQPPPQQHVEAPPQQQAHASPQTATAPPRSLAKPPAATQAPAKAPAVPAAAPAPHAPAAQASTGSAMLQIGSYKSQDEANSAWTAYQKKHPITGGYSSDVKQVDLGDKGTWYRLRIGPFDSKSAASELCDKLKADGASCIPAAP